jgi:hypothetical protein
MVVVVHRLSLFDWVRLPLGFEVRFGLISDLESLFEELLYIVFIRLPLFRKNCFLGLFEFAMEIVFELIEPLIFIFSHR